MGPCLSRDIKSTKYAVGGSSGAILVKNSQAREAQDAAALLSGVADCTSWVEIRLACVNLKSADVLSKSDPMGVLYEAPSAKGPGKEIGRTEVIKDNYSPTFTVAFRVLYNFEKLQPLRLLVVDIDRGHNPATVDPAKCDFLGEHTFTLSELVTSKDHQLTCKLNTRSAHVSKAILSVEELSSARDVITCQLAATGLKNIELLSKSDPYVEISKKQQGDGAAGWQPVFRTEVKNNNLDPVWAPFTMRSTQLNNGDSYRPLLLKVLDHEDSGKPRLLGQIETSAANLEEACKTMTRLPLTMPGKTTTGLGSLVVRSWEVVSQPTFLDYISAGTEISFLVALDFTASNKSPLDPVSLHYAAPGAFTRYEEALCGVGRVLEYYDSDRLFPAFGFGGVSGKNPVSHCFPLNGQPQDPQCAGIQGIMGAYRQALANWRLSGPTLFAPVIRAASAIAAQPSATLRYTVLLILTDGEIMDMNETVDAIITASGLPMSILIVGIGDADFTKMVQLDGDDRKLALDGRIAERDIVQFVEFRKFANNGEALAAELLAELPGQFLAYTRARKIPLPTAPPATAPPP